MNGHVLVNSDTGLNAGGGCERYPLLNLTPKSPERGANSGFYNRGGMSLGAGDLAVHHGRVTQHRPVCDELSLSNHTFLQSNVSQHSETCVDRGYMYNI